MRDVSICTVVAIVCRLQVGSFKSSDHQPFPSQSALDVILSAWIRSFYSSLPPWFPLPSPSHTLAYTRARLVWIFITRAAASSKRWIIPNLNSRHGHRLQRCLDRETSHQPLLTCSPLGLWSRASAAAIVALGKQTPRITPGPSVGFDIQATSFDFSVLSPFLHLLRKHPLSPHPLSSSHILLGPVSSWPSTSSCKLD